MSAAWASDSIGGLAVTLFTPATPPRFGLLFLLDADNQSLADSEVYTALLRRHNLAGIALPACPSWWSDRLLPAVDPRLSGEQFVLQKVVPLFRERWNLAPRAVGIAGIGMGGQGALRLAFRHPDIFPVVAGIGPAIDYHELYGEGTALDEMYDSKEQCRQDTALMHINPYQYPPQLFFCIDPADAAWFRGNDRLHEKLNALGIAHTADLDTRAGGHTLKYFERMAEQALRFVVEGLDKESRRLL